MEIDNAIALIILAIVFTYWIKWSHDKDEERNADLLQSKTPVLVNQDIKFESELDKIFDYDGIRVVELDKDDENADLSIGREVKDGG